MVWVPRSWWVSPGSGSGSAGRACVRLGIHYASACCMETHAAWLGNVLDPEACELVVKSESPMFKVGLAEMVKTNLSDVLDQLEQQRTAQALEPED